MAEAEKSLGSVRFGPFELSLETQELRKHGIPVSLFGQAIQILLVLTANPGRLVTREELQQKLWPGASYGDPEHGLNAAVNKLREKLGDSATTPTYIETLQGRGYRFIGKIESDESGPSPDEPEPPKPRRKWKAALIAVALVLAGAALLYPWLKPLIERQIRVAQLQRLTVVPLTSLPGNVMSPTFSPDGSQVAFAWDGENNGKGFDLYVKVIGNEKPLRLTNRPAFESNRSGSNEVWVSDTDGSNALQLSSFGIRLTGTPRWSPDGNLIAFDSRAGGEGNVYIVDPHGGIPHKLNIDIRGNTQPSWSRDGKSIYFVNGADAHQPTAWKVPSTGGHAVPITKGEAGMPVESTDGRLVYFIRRGRLWSARTDGTNEQQVEEMPGSMYEDAWTPVRSGIYFMGWNEAGKSVIEYLDLGTRKVRVLYVLE